MQYVTKAQINVKTAAQRDRDARDPAAEALRSELGGTLLRLAETLRDEP